MAARRLTHLSLYYPLSYLVPAGVLFLAAPQLALKLFFSSQPQAYGDIMPRMAGALTLGLGLLVAQVIRLRLDALHATIVGVRVLFVAVWLWLYARSADPFFLALAALVGLGMILSAVALALDERRPPVGGPKQ